MDTNSPSNIRTYSSFYYESFELILVVSASCFPLELVRAPDLAGIQLVRVSLLSNLAKLAINVSKCLKISLTVSLVSFSVIGLISRIDLIYRVF